MDEDGGMRAPPAWIITTTTIVVMHNTWHDWQLQGEWFHLGDNGNNGDVYALFQPIESSRDALHRPSSCCDDCNCFTSWLTAALRCWDITAWFVALALGHIRPHDDAMMVFYVCYTLTYVGYAKCMELIITSQQWALDWMWSINYHVVGGGDGVDGFGNWF